MPTHYGRIAGYDYEHTFTKYKQDKEIFIETGTHVGHGVKRALRSGFRKIISIEPHVKSYKHCVEEFEGDKRVELHNDYSENVLGKILKGISEPCVFFLDGHYQKWNEVETPPPLPLELDEIDRHHIKGHTIIIDDYELPYHGKGKTFTDSIKKIQQMSPIYRFELIPHQNGVLIAYMP